MTRAGTVMDAPEAVFDLTSGEFRATGGVEMTVGPGARTQEPKS